MAKILDGKKVAQKIKEEVKKEVLDIKRVLSKTPVLACVCVGKTGSSDVYVKAQSRVAAEVGIGYRLVALKENVSFKELVDEIQKLNDDCGVGAIMVQKPLPAHIDLFRVGECIAPHKDAEGIHPLNLGNIVLDKGDICHTCPPTAAACMNLLSFYKIFSNLFGKEVVIVGHSPNVGKPLSLMLLNALATVTVCHIATSKADKLAGHVQQAEILIAAVGKPGVIKGEWIKEGAVVIDVGINCVGGRIIGDVEFAPAEKRASYITPVPGGVGPVTVAMLMKNSVALSRACMEGVSL